MEHPYVTSHVSWSKPLSVVLDDSVYAWEFSSNALDEKPQLG